MSDGIEFGLATNEPFGQFVYWAVIRHPKEQFSNQAVDQLIRKEFPNRLLARGGTGAYQPIPLQRSYAKNQPKRLGIKNEVHAKEVLTRIDSKMNSVEESGLAYILCWNPKNWDWPNYDKVVARSASGESIHEPWSTGSNKSILEGQRVYLYRQAIQRGIVGSGWTTSGYYSHPHWDGSGKLVPYADIVFDRLISPDDVLPVEGLIRRFPKVNWNRIQASGVALPSGVSARLEAIWQDHLKGLGFRIEPTELRTPALYVEGSSHSITVNAYERNLKARKVCIDHYGFACVVCGFNFANFYGDIGEGFIHVHHLKDLATVGGEYKVDPIKDLRPVCPNCHAMLHVETPAMSIAKLRSIIDARRA